MTPEKNLLLIKRPVSQGARTCPQTDHNTHVLRVSLHDDGGQDLAAEQGGLEAVGEGVEAAVTEHCYLVVDGAPSERQLWGQARGQDPRAPPASCVSAGRGPSFPSPRLAPQTCTLLRPRLKPRDNYGTVKGRLLLGRSKQHPTPHPQKRAPKADVLTVFGCASGDLERRSIVLLRLAPVTGVTSAKPNCSAFSLSPIKTRRAASAASCLPCFLLCAHTAGNQRPPTFAW